MSQLPFAADHPFGFGYLPSEAKPTARTLVRGLLLGAALLASCSDEKSSRSSELRTDAATTPREDQNATTAPAPNPDDRTEVDHPMRAENRYRVVVETAYFYDSPKHTKPNGRYLLRGDVLYGEEQQDGFVRTRFKTPNGATVTGWLKAAELGRLAASPSTMEAQNRTRPVDRKPAASTEPTEFSYEMEPPKEAPAPAPRASIANAKTAVVQAAKSYFYNSADLSQPRKAHCVRGDKVRLGEERGEAVYVTFTNWENVTSTGWMRKDALRPVR
ncbi:hypothetical protein GCM10027346_07750 [Hymenobacter seoulensis]